MRRRAASVLVVSAIAAVVVVIAGVVVATRSSDKSNASAASNGAPITILWIGDTTGPAKAYGALQLAGVKGAADYYNRRGGIEGHRVYVHAVSDNADPAVAASVLSEQLASGTPTMVWAGSIAADSGAMIPILARHRVFAIALTDGQAQCRSNASVVCPHEFSLGGSTRPAQQTAADWIKTHRYTKVGLLEETTTYSAAETPEFLKAATQNGLAVSKVSFPPTTLDLTAQLQELKQAGAQVVYSEGLGAAQYALTARANLSWNVPIIFDPPASSLDLTKLTAAANLKDAYANTPYEVDRQIANPALPTMIQWAGRYADVQALPLTSTSTGWDSVVLLNAAVQQAGGSLNVDQLDAAMLKIHASDPLYTIYHKVGYTNDNHQNVLVSTDDYVVTPVGPLVNGRIQAP